jgi:geranylgeranyl reductase family protein
MLRKKCDVLVIGAGPAGSSVARVAAGGGLEVILVDKKRRVGFPVRCAEFVPWRLGAEVSLPSWVVSQSIRSMRTHLPNGEVSSIRSHGFVIHRNLFDRYLVAQAESSGAKVVLGGRAFDLKDGRVILCKESEVIEVEARIVVGADGPASLVAKWVGARNMPTLRALQYLMPLRTSQEATDVYFAPYIPGGYGWVFPKRSFANVGIGLDPTFGTSPKNSLSFFIDFLVKRGIIERKVLRRATGLIPVGGLRRLVFQNILLAGDAGGFVHPVTGAGVQFALFSGEAAGRAIKCALETGNMKNLFNYRDEVMDLLAGLFDHAKRRREYLIKNWSGDIEELSWVVRKTWVGYREYWM